METRRMKETQPILYDEGFQSFLAGNILPQQGGIKASIRLLTKAGVFSIYSSNETEKTKMATYFNYQPIEVRVNVFSLGMLRHSGLILSLYGLMCTCQITVEFLGRRQVIFQRNFQLPAPAQIQGYYSTTVNLQPPSNIQYESLDSVLRKISKKEQYSQLMKFSSRRNTKFRQFFKNSSSSTFRLCFQHDTGSCLRFTISQEFCKFIRPKLNFSIAIVLSQVETIPKRQDNVYEFNSFISGQWKPQGASRVTFNLANSTIPPTQSIPGVYDLRYMLKARQHTSTTKLPNLNLLKSFCKDD